MQRRGFMTAAGGMLAAVSGCIGTASSPRNSASPALEVTIDAIQLQYGVVIPNSPDSIGISNPDTPYLVVSVTVAGPLTPDEFGLHHGDVRYAPTRLDRLYRTSWGDDSWYERGRTEGLILFEAPPAATRPLALTWPGGEQPIENGIIERLNAGTPGLSASIRVPDEHDTDTAPPVDIEVTNEGEIARRFLGALNRVGPLVAYTPVTRLSELVTAGDTETISVSDDWAGLPGEDRIGDGRPDVRYHLAYPGGEDTAEIRIGGSS